MRNMRQILQMRQIWKRFYVVVHVEKVTRHPSSMYYRSKFGSNFSNGNRGFCAAFAIRQSNPVVVKERGGG